MDLNLQLLATETDEIKTCPPTKGSAETKNTEWNVQSTVQDSSFMPTLAVTVWMGWNGGLVLMLILSIFLNNTYRAVLFGTLILSAILPREFPGELGLRIGEWIVKNGKLYFGLKTTLEDEGAIDEYNKKNKAVIFACEPHDLLPYSIFCFHPCLKVLPGRVGETNAALMTSAVFKIPIIKQVYTWVKGAPVDKHTFLTRLQNGESLAFVPGGVQEVLNMDPKKPNEIPLYIKDRKGFVKLALQTGSPIVPVFFFGLHGSFGYYVPRGILISKIARTIGFLPVLFWGRFGIPLGIPKPKKQHVVFGKPIDVPHQGDKVTNEMVNQIHSIYVEELCALFERHKHAEGYGERTLKIL